MAIKRKQPLAPWAVKAEAELTRIGYKKPALAKAMGVDLSTVYRWMVRDLDIKERRQVDAGLSALRSELETPLETVDRTVDQVAAVSAEQRVGAALRRLGGALIEAGQILAGESLADQMKGEVSLPSGETGEPPEDRRRAEGNG